MEPSVLLNDKGLVVSAKDACIKMNEVVDIFFVSNRTLAWSESLTELSGKPCAIKLSGNTRYNCQACDSYSLTLGLLHCLICQ